MPKLLTPENLYNCCTDWAEPDWSQYCELEISAVKMNVDEDGGTWCTSAHYAHDADMFTVYARKHADAESGIKLADAITDVTDALDVLAVAGYLGYRAKLPVFIDVAMGIERPKFD